MDLVQLADCGLGLMHRVPEQPRRSQRGAPVHAQVRFYGAETLESLRRVIKAAQRLREVAEPQGDQAKVHPDLARFQFLAACVEQILGSAQVGDAASRRTRQ